MKSKTVSAMMPPHRRSGAMKVKVKKFAVQEPELLAWLLTMGFRLVNEMGGSYWELESRNTIIQVHQGYEDTGEALGLTLSGQATIAFLAEGWEYEGATEISCAELIKLKTREDIFRLDREY